MQNFIPPAAHVLSDTDGLPPHLDAIAVLAAHEGVPVMAICRIIQATSEHVYPALREAIASGRLTEMPRPDWPPTARRQDHLPTLANAPSDQQMIFLLRRHFKLTNLEAGFLLVLLKTEHAEKAKLHGVVEQQRMNRQQRPDKMEATDPKMVDVMICKLRKKLRDVDNEIVIDTIWGGGYLIKAEVKSAIFDRITPAHGDEHVQESAVGAPAERDSQRATAEGS